VKCLRDRPSCGNAGIEAYDDGGMLAGGVNDIDAVQRLLVDRVGATFLRRKL
jgi:hypothetical protein